jgi:ABC-type dipeptide/oligopeptide/nickel transport system permease component
MLTIVVRRLLMSVPVLIGISIIVFSMMHLAPGDPAEAMLGPLRTEETLTKVRHELGLDQPLYVQYFTWTARAITGDLGNSIRLNRPVLPEVVSRFTQSFILAAAAFAIAVVVGLAAGVISATRRGGIIDRIVTVATVIGVSMPPFYLGMILIVLFSVKLGLLPAGGMYDIRAEPSTEELLKHLILPAVTLSAAPLTVIARISRSSMLEVIGQDFIRTARAKGLAEHGVVLRHALHNAVIPVVSVLGLEIGYLLSATALVEVVFSWPGLGSLLVQSVVTRDLPLAQGAVLLIALIYVVANLVSDVTQAALDPRISLA